MRSPILEAGERILFPGQVLFALYFLLRGHQAPGGGFIAGLIMSGAFLIKFFAYPQFSVWLQRRLPPSLLLTLGWSLALGSGLWSFFSGTHFMQSVWGPGVELPLLGKVQLSTVFIFDVGVFFLVWGMTLSIVLEAFED